MSLPKGLKGKLVYQTSDQAEILALAVAGATPLASGAFEYTEDFQKKLAALPAQLETVKRFLTAQKAMAPKEEKKTTKAAGAPKKSGGNAKTKASLEVRAAMGLKTKGKVPDDKKAEFDRRVEEKLAKKS